MPTDAFTNAVTAFRAGAPTEAEEQLQRLLQTSPHHTEGLNLLGIIAMRSGRYEQARALIERALAVEPGNASLHCNLGECYRTEGRPDAAEPHYRKALSLRPRYPTAHYNLGLALAARDKVAEAAESYRRALALKPDYVKAHTNRGNVLKRLEDPEGALNHHRRAVEASGGHPDTLYNLANTLAALDRLEDAESAYRRVLEHRPEHVGALNNLGINLRGRDRLQEALYYHERAVAAQPDDSPSLVNLGILLKDLKRLGEAIDCMERARVSSPEDPDVLCNLADLLSEAARDAEALVAWRQALALDPGCLRAHDGLGGFYGKREEMEQAREHLGARLKEEPDNLVLRLRLDRLCPTVFPDTRAIDDYRADLLRKLDGYAGGRWRLELEDASRYGCHPAFNLPYQGRDDLEIKRKHADLLQRHLPVEAPLAPRTGVPRLGLVATGGHESVFIGSVLTNINRFSRDRLRMTVICPSASIDRIREHVRHPDLDFLPLASSLPRAVHDIREARLDLLYYHEVGTDTVNYILPFFRLAPVQCTSWGIQVTSGIPNMGYYISSRWMEPKGAQAHYREKLILLDSMLKQRTPARLTQAKSRADFGLPERQSLYFCPQYLGKLHPEFDPVIGEILRRDPSGMLLLLEHPSAADAKRLMERCRRTIPAVAERIRVLPAQKQQDYYSLIALSDLLLDPLHFGGVNTTYDALALSKAVVTLPGEFQRGRFTLGCYRKMGVMDSVARTEREYVEIAVHLATDAAYRGTVERRIAEHSPALFESDRIAGELEDCLLDLIETARGREPARLRGLD